MSSLHDLILLPMVKLTLTSPSVVIAASTLDELKQELGRLNSYTNEIGTAREAAASTLKAATGVVSLVDQLGQLQRTQLVELKQANTSNLASQKRDLAALAETWSSQWLSDAAKSLSTLDGAAVMVGKAAEMPRQAAHLLDCAIVKFSEEQHQHQQAISAQHQSALHVQKIVLEKQLAEWLAQLTLEQSELRTSMRSASDEFVVTTKSQEIALAGLIEHQQKLTGDLAFLGEAMRPAAKFGEMLQGMQQEIKAMNATHVAASELMQGNIEKSFDAIDQQSCQLHRNVHAVAGELAGIRQTLIELEARSSSQNADLMRQLADQVTHQSMAQDALRAKTLAERASTRIWQGLTLAAAIGAIVAGLLPR
jgi:hypothetical protein